MTSMTPTTIDRDSTRPKPRKSVMSNGFCESLMIVPTRRLTSLKTPMPDRIIHSTATMTTPAMPRATEMRNDIFIADQGSTRETVSLTRRARAAAAADWGPAGRPGAAAGREAPGVEPGVEPAWPWLTLGAEP